MNMDLERAREEVAHHDARFGAKIRLVHMEIEREHYVTIQTLQEDLCISMGTMEQQSNDFEKEKAFLGCA